jgi:hypothetical protein
MRVTLVLVSAPLAIAAMSGEANAQTGQGRGRQCGPVMSKCVMRGASNLAGQREPT